MKVTVKETIWREYTIAELDETMVKEELAGTLEREGVEGMAEWLIPFTTGQRLQLETAAEIGTDFNQAGYSTVCIEDGRGNILWENDARSSLV